MKSQFARTVFTAITLLTGIRREAEAQACIPANSVSGSNLTYSICGASDIDQRRATINVPPFPVAGLPNDGSMYCAPTAIMNFMAYMASHGPPWIKPGPKDFGPQFFDPADDGPNYSQSIFTPRSYGV